jgi:hypothetical protein
MAAIPALLLLVVLAACAVGRGGAADQPDPCELVIAIWAKVNCPGSGPDRGP